MREKVIEESAQVVHVLFVWVEAISLLAFVLTLCYIVLRVYRDPTVPSVVRNRVLFGLLGFGLAVFAIREFAPTLSTDTKGVLLGVMFTAVVGIITFLFDKDKESAEDSTGNEIVESNRE